MEPALQLQTSSTVLTLLTSKNYNTLRPESQPFFTGFSFSTESTSRSSSAAKLSVTSVNSHLTHFSKTIPYITTFDHWPATSPHHQRSSPRPSTKPLCGRALTIVASTVWNSFKLLLHYTCTCLMTIKLNPISSHLKLFPNKSPK